MAQIIHCKENGCPLSVEYVPQTTPGGIGFQTRKLPLKEVTVYLTCGNDHVHAYTVQTGHDAASDD